MQRNTIRNNRVTDIQLANFSDSRSDSGSKEDDSPQNHPTQTLTPKEAYRYFAKNYRHRAANSRSITRCSIFTPLVRVGRPFVSVA